MILFGLILTSALLYAFAAQTVEVQYVQFGDTVSMSCNLTSYHDTAWFRENPLGPPTLVVYSSLRKGDTVYGYQVDPRFTVAFEDRSLTLTITDISKNDLGMYFCLVFVNTELLVGSATVLQGPFWFGFYQSYCTAVGAGLLFMVISVCVVHCKTKEHRQTSLREEERLKTTVIYMPFLSLRRHRKLL
ncbi:hypothetical protein WMY93_006241 [Mugilogobius chulae]|uniref:Ig-like domain-containing protein n=1 Tax=Mugilogobius chulae TaxID=88201 RepID=A0AAW0PVR2_9GOBI